MNSLKSLFEFEYGVCSFDSVKDRLISCKNKERIPQNAKSIILFVFPYKIRAEKPENISRYAAVPDYHKVVMDILERYVSTLKTANPDYEFVPFADNSPVPEVFAAATAGLGVKGENGLLITEKYGSFVFIGEIVTDLPLESENRYKECNKCGICKRECPISLKKELCLSAVTQKKGELTESEEKLLKESGCIWGCDICAENCPMNKDKQLSNIDVFIKDYRNNYSLNEDSLNRPYAWRGEKVIKRNHNILYKK